MLRLIILPGWEQDSSHWKHIVSKLTDYNPLVIDLPALTDTPLIDSSWGIPEYAEFVINEIENLGEESIILLGHSFGGRIAGYIASQNPKWLKKLILYAAPCLFRPPLKIRIIIALVKLRNKFGLQNIKFGINKEYELAKEQGKGEIYRNAIWYDQTNQLPKIKVPTLIFWGTQDEETPPSIGEEMHQLISQSKLIVVDNLDHNIHLNNPNIFYGTVKKYVEDI